MCLIKYVANRAYLDMQWARSRMADEQEHESLLPRAAVRKHVSVPIPEDDKANDLEPPGPATTLRPTGVECPLEEVTV